MTRKIIQITVSAVPGEHDCVYALCSDDSLWAWSLWQGVETSEWRRIEDIPQDNEDKTKRYEFIPQIQTIPARNTGL